MPRTVDLNARRAAREEALGGKPTFTIGDDRFEMPAEMPLEVADLLAQGELGKGLALCLGEEQYSRLKPYALSVNDIKEIFELYQVPLAKQDG